MWALDQVTGPCIRFPVSRTCRMFLTLLLLLGSARVEQGVDSVTLDSEVFEESRLSSGKLPGKNSVGLYPVASNSSRSECVIRSSMI